jgi:ferrous iron transport protein A
MLPLGLLKRGERAEVIEIRAGGHLDVRGPRAHGKDRSRIEDMGLREGIILEMLSNEGKGAILIRIDESRLAIGRGIAMKVMVRRKE